MKITQEKIQELKKQVLEQINSTFPPEKKQAAIQQIEAMDQEQFIEFLNQNKLIQTKASQESTVQEPLAQEKPYASGVSGFSEEQETPFRQIVQEKIPSYKIDENKECIAVLEINPVSTGHCIIIPKNPVHEPSKIPQQCFSLTKKLSRKLKTKFKPKDVLISSSNVLGETIINVIPKYENETLESQRKQASQKDLETLQKTLEKKSRAKSRPNRTSKKSKKSDSKSKEIIPKRIP